MSLTADFTLTRGAFELAVDLFVDDGECLALVGPNGAGKSTVLAALAGLVPIDRGTVRLGDVLLDGGSSESFRPAEARDLGVVLQDPTLFPHLSVLDNVAFGPRARGRSRAAARDRARGELARGGLLELAERAPRDLSGGQAQRVALARALATDPAALLLDEPLSAVDASARGALRVALRAHLADFAGPCVLVSHDPLDAFALADRVAVLEDGRVVQSGSVEEISGRPSTPYVADLVGLNLFHGTLRARELELVGGGRLVVASGEDGPALATVHPRAVSLFRARPDGSPRNVWRAPVLGVEPAGTSLRVRLGGEVPLVAEVTHAARRDLALEPGREVWVAVKASEVQAYAGRGAPA